MGLFSLFQTASSKKSTTQAEDTPLDIHQNDQNTIDADLIAPLTLVVHYLNGELQSKELRKKLQTLCQKNQKDARALFQSTIITTPEQSILFKLLCLPEIKHADYRVHEKLHHLLVHLQEDDIGHGHLTHLLTIIDETHYTKPFSWLKWLSIAVSPFLLPILDKIDHRLFHKITTMLIAKIGHGLDHFFTKYPFLRNIPFLGIVWNSFNFLRFVFHTFRNGFSNIERKLAAVSFRGIATGLSIAAYVLCFLAMGVMSPLITSFFIASSLIDAIEACSSYYYITQKTGITHENAPTLSKQQIEISNLRLDNQKRHGTADFAIKLTYAILMSVIVAVWCLFPPSILPSLIVSVICIITMCLCSSIKSTISAHFERKYTNELQTTINAYLNSQGGPAPSNSASPNTIPEEDLNQSPTYRMPGNSFFPPPPAKEEDDEYSDEDLLDNSYSL